MIRSLSLRTRCAAASTRASVAPVARLRVVRALPRADVVFRAVEPDFVLRLAAERAVVPAAPERPELDRLDPALLALLREPAHRVLRDPPDLEPPPLLACGMLPPSFSPMTVRTLPRPARRRRTAASRPLTSESQAALMIRPDRNLEKGPMAC